MDPRPWTLDLRLESLRLNQAKRLPFFCIGGPYQPLDKEGVFVGILKILANWNGVVYPKWFQQSFYLDEVGWVASFFLEIEKRGVENELDEAS